MIALRTSSIETGRSDSNAGTPADAEPLAQRIIEYIDANYATSISLRDVAEAFGYSPCHLTHTFSRTTGTPITAWIIKRRIEAATQLFAEADVDVATACERVGFNDLCYFTRQFVRHVGVTPGRFRSATRSGRVPGGMSRGAALKAS
jgi:AraC-like DNA-binding protein